MEKIEVDPKLFITCRLCLEEMGLYQIAPIIQQKIKYCFDIDVAPFDGLPQLICKKCEEKLSEYHLMKTTYTEKQNSLINNLHCQDATDKDKDGQTQPEADMVNRNRGVEIKEVASAKNDEKIKRRKRRTKSITSESSSDDICMKSAVSKSTTPTEQPKISTTSWRNNYSKHFCCKLCASSSVKKSYLMKHIAKVHSKWRSKYANILNKNCTVQMNKIDDLPNITNSMNTVVFNRDVITQNDDNSKYFIVYKLKEDMRTSENYSTNINRKEEICSDSTDDFVFPNNRKRRKKIRRILSTDTVVIEEKKRDQSPSTTDNEEEMAEQDTDKCNVKEIVTECINIDSESEPGDFETAVPRNIANQEQNDSDAVKLKAMRNIIEVCHSKYLRKLSHSVQSKGTKKYTEIESQLEHKILSMGRKVINKHGINCAGLLRFMEHRNLGIHWLPKAYAETANYVRINVTKLKRDCVNLEENIGWTSLSHVAYPVISGPSISQCNKISYEDRQDLDSHEVNSDYVTVDTTTSQNPLKIAQEKGNQAVLYKCNESDVNLKSKLLNESPVANPKQLPKSYDTKYHSNKVDKLITVGKNDQSILIDVDNEEKFDSGLCMPIITSTTSLALTAVGEPGNENGDNADVVASNKQPPSTSNVPRIKVKPVSELMPQNACDANVVPLVNRGLQNNIWQMDQNEVTNAGLSTQNNFYPNILVSQNQNTVFRLQVPNTNTAGPRNMDAPGDNKTNKEYVILDTIDLPNTKTSSPFVYFQDLLKIHNLTLLDNSDNINKQESICLIKFKVQFKQENIRPIVLCLSLYFCYSNIFYMAIKDSNHMPISMYKISANWQWEILKIYQGDVHKKILQNASKMGLIIHDIIKKFIFLLKSIQLKRVSEVIKYV